MESQYPLKTNLNPGWQQRKCTTTTAGRDSKEKGGRFPKTQLQLRWERCRWEKQHVWTTSINRLSVVEKRTRRRLGILLPDWLEVSPKGALLGHVPSPALEEKDGPIRPHRSRRHLQTRRSIGGCRLTAYSSNKRVTNKAVVMATRVSVLSESHPLIIFCAFCSCKTLAHT